MAPNRSRQLLTSDRSKLAKADLPLLLRNPGAWSTLPLATRQQLYALLPQPEAGEPSHNPDVNPLETELRPHIEAALRRYQEDLKEGRETKKWRTEALEAGEKRRKGEFDEVLRADREKWYGPEREHGAEEESKGEAQSGVMNGAGKEAAGLDMRRHEPSS